MLTTLIRGIVTKNIHFLGNYKYVTPKQRPRDFHVSHVARSSPCGDDCESGSDGTALMEPACKTALVNGGSGGIGYAIAYHLLKNKAKQVAITGNDVNKGKEAVYKLNGAFGQNKAMFISANLTCLSQLEEMFRTVKESYNNIDIVVNCAGIIDGKHWEREVVTNVIGTIRGSLLTYKYIGKEGQGRGGVMVNVCGIQGIVPEPSMPTFTSTQHAIVGLTTSFGDGWHVARTGVRVVALVVGATNTSFGRGLEKKGMSPALGTEMVQARARAKKQNPEAVGQAAVHVVRCGKSGSMWVVYGSNLYEVVPESWEKHKKLAAQYV